MFQKTDKKFFSNGETNNLYTEGGPEAYEQIKAYAISNITSGTIDLPANSVNFVLFQPQVVTNRSTQKVEAFNLMRKDKRTFVVQGIHGTTSFSIYDAKGKLCLNKDISNNEIIHLNSFTPGVYFIKVWDQSNDIQQSIKVHLP